MSNETFTASSVFLSSLLTHGITHLFVNWGSDHPGLLEDLTRSNPFTVLTCPNEMVALSCAQGYAQLHANARVACVIVHVDVGTQALGGAVHNVDRSHTPVLIYAGASPYSGNGDGVKGGRNEWIQWIQDIPDQPAIIRQYMRYTHELNNSAVIDSSIRRSLSIALSEPKGPVYLWARREAMESPLSSLTPSSTLPIRPIGPGAIPDFDITQILEALKNAKNPLILTSHLGRNPASVPLLSSLASEYNIGVFCPCPSVLNISYSHPNFLGISYLQPNTYTTYAADVVVMLDVDIPWVSANQTAFSEETKYWIVDSDPMKVGSQMGVFDIGVNVQGLYKADSYTILQQLLSHPIPDSYEPPHREFPRKELKKTRTTEILDVLNEALPEGRIVLNEAISNYPAVWDCLKPQNPGSFFTSGGSSLGWALGASIGAVLSLREQQQREGGMVVNVVGDGSFLFGVPSSAFWMARKYETPFLTVVLNNGGWNSPKLSMLGVHPTGLASTKKAVDLTTGFGPHTPDYGGIAKSATGDPEWLETYKILPTTTPSEIAQIFNQAVHKVTVEKRGVLVECVIETV